MRCAKYWIGDAAPRGKRSWIIGLSHALELAARYAGSHPSGRERQGSTLSLGKYSNRGSRGGRSVKVPAESAASSASVWAARLRRHMRSLVFLVALGLLAGVTWIGWRQSARVEATSAWVERTHEVAALRSRLLATTEEIERDVRGFVLTGDPAILVQFESGVSAVTDTQQGLVCTHRRRRAANPLLCPVAADRRADRRRAPQRGVAPQRRARGRDAGSGQRQE